MTEPAPRPLKVGDPVPEFSGRTATGTTVSRADLAGRPAVLYFYPKASSLGCTLEAREFARRSDDFAAAGARVIGISVDTEAAQRSFQDSCDLPFDLIADHGRAISRAFGVLGALGFAQRTTFLVGPDGRLTGVIRSWRPREHARRALEALAAAGAAGAPTGAGSSPGGPEG